MCYNNPLFNFIKLNSFLFLFASLSRDMPIVLSFHRKQNDFVCCLLVCVSVISSTNFYYYSYFFNWVRSQSVFLEDERSSLGFLVENFLIFQMWKFIAITIPLKKTLTMLQTFWQVLPFLFNLENLFISSWIIQLLTSFKCALFSL